MRLSFVKLECILLLIVGFAGLLFILYHAENELPTLDKEQHRLTIQSHLPVAPSKFKKLNWLPGCQENKSMERIEGNYERRASIRQTWGEETSYRGAEVKRIFLSGTSKYKRTDQRYRWLLKTESQKYGDILQWDFHDTFYNLTLKQFLFHEWLNEYCPGANFIFNGDDDVFVNTFNVVTYISDHEADKHLFVGDLVDDGSPIREDDSKYYVPVQVTASETYPMYCGGGGILISKYTAHVIYNQSQDIQLFPIDDVYLGMCLAKAGLVPTSHMGIRTMGVIVPSTKIDSFNACYYRELLMVHPFKPYEMLIMWNSIQDPHLNCVQKVPVFLGV